MYWVYILKSLVDQRHYIGQTNNLDKRLEQNNKGKATATKHRSPLRLVHKEGYSTLEEAVKREKFFKTHRGYNYLKKLGLY